MSWMLQKLAEKSGISPSYLDRIEHSERLPSAGVLKKIVRPLNFNLKELFTMAGYLPPQSGYKVGLKSKNGNGSLDPYVSWTLSQETLEVQRAVQHPCRG